LDWPTLELLRAFDELPIPIVATGGPTVAHAALLVTGSELLDELKMSDQSNQHYSNRRRRTTPGS
jgi:hypothetical protein